MPVFKFVIAEPESRKCVQVEVDQSKAMGVIGKKIGDEFSGDIIGLNGYTLKITGGTDKDGFPMHPSLKGPGRKKILLNNPPCFHPRLKGQRKRKTVRGNTISENIAQINVKIVKKGEKSLAELFPEKMKEKPRERKIEEIKTEKKEVKEQLEEKKEGNGGEKN